MKQLNDPGKWRAVSRWNPRRLVCWTLKNRWYRIYSRLTFKLIGNLIERNKIIYFNHRGDSLCDTYVTTRQQDLLVKAIQVTEYFKEPVIEIGSYRGATTKIFAANTNRLVYAVDPFTGFGGCEEDFILFREAIKVCPTIRHIRKTSGGAFEDLRTLEFSFVFVDAVHDYPNTWFDFAVWGSLLRIGGMIGLHDVDDWPGTNLACRRIILQRKDFVLWAYCPNLVIFRKTT
jgi:hypothetical protein